MKTEEHFKVNRLASKVVEKSKKIEEYIFFERNWLK